MRDNLEHVLKPALGKMCHAVSPDARRRISQRIALAVRQSQQARIRRQQNPDGSSYAGRKRRILRTQKGVVFLRNNEVRRLKNWSAGFGKYGRTITGFDEVRGDIRTFYRSDIARFLEINTQSIRRETRKNVPMFQRLRTARYLKTRATTDSAEEGFDGIAARIARMHQYGGRERLATGAYATYPSRELLGLTIADQAMIADTIINSISGGPQ